MVTVDEFDSIEKRHNELMLLIDEQVEVMKTINGKNWFMFCMDWVFFHESRNAHLLTCRYLEEAKFLLQKFNRGE